MIASQSTEAAYGVTDRVLTIPTELDGEATWGHWLIRDGMDKLRLKYGQILHSREFDAYSAARVAQDQTWLHRVEIADLLVTWLMQSQIERRPGAIEAVMDRRNEIEAALAKVPSDLSLEKEVPDSVWQQLRFLFEAFRVKGVAVATMTKVLCMKRPALIPMMDTHVMGFLFKKRWPFFDRRKVQNDAEASVLGMKQFRKLMLHGENLKVLSVIHSELIPWLTQLEVSSHLPPTPSLVRILDSLLWYDWNGHSYFGQLQADSEPSILIAMLHHRDHAVRWRAAKALGNVKPVAQGTVSSLKELRDREGEESLVGWWAGWALNEVAKISD